MDDPTQYLRFAAALVFVLALIGAAAYALRVFGFLSLAQRRPGDRRLSVVESLLIDARRRIVIVRRDDKEHLILISPTGDTLVESGFDAKPVAEPQTAGANVVAFKADAQP